MTEKGQVYSSYFDGRPCREASIDDIDVELFKNEYRPKAVSPTTLAKDKRTPIQQMASLRLSTHGLIALLMPEFCCWVMILNILFREHISNMLSLPEQPAPQRC